MTDLNDLVASPRRANLPTWLAIAAASLLLPAGSALAAQADPSETVDPASTTGVDAEPVVPGPVVAGPAADETVAAEPVTAQGPKGPLYPPTTVTSPLPGTTERPAMQGEFYGPPSPKSEKGKLPEIGWVSAPAGVPPALENAVHIVTANYPSVKSSRAALRAAASDVRAAKWLRAPSLTADLAYRDADNSPVPQFTVELPVWTGGRIGAAIDRAEASEEVSSSRYLETVQTLALSTVQTYFQIASLTFRQQALAGSVSEHRKLVATMERRVAQEVSPLADLELVRSRTAQVEQEYNLVRAQRDTSLRVMAELVADPNYDLGPLPFYDPAIPLPDTVSLEDQAVAFDPTRRRLLSEADEARAQFKATKASLFPQVASQYTYDDFYKSRFGVVLKMQTNSGLSQFAQLEGARLRIDAANQSVLVAEQQLRRTVASDVIEYQAARERSGISANASATAAKVSASYMRQFIAGRRSWLDVMNALREAVSAQIGLTDAEMTVLWSRSRLLLRSGRWHPTFDNHEK